MRETINKLTELKKYSQKEQVNGQFTDLIISEFTKLSKIKDISRTLYLEVLMYQELEKEGMKIAAISEFKIQEAILRKNVISRLQIAGRADLANGIIAGTVNWKEYVYMVRGGKVSEDKRPAAENTDIINANNIYFFSKHFLPAEKNEENIIDDDEPVM